MARDNNPRARQEYNLRRKQGNRDPADRILIVSEGSKTEPNYFTEIRRTLRLQTANICTIPSIGTCPLQVVRYAKEIFDEGHAKEKIKPKAFEKVYAVFDRDDHLRYNDALVLAEEYKALEFKNDQKQVIDFTAIASVPCFELWLLIHFENRHAAMHRNKVYSALNKHIPGYRKGDKGLYDKTQQYYERAKGFAELLAKQNSATDGTQLYTDMHTLVGLLKDLKKKA